MRRSPRHLTALIVALSLAVSVAPSAASPAVAAGGSSFVQVINGYRVDGGRDPVALNAVIDDIAVHRAHVMAVDRDLGHDLAYVKDRLNDAGICWSRVGEIVAYNGSGSYEAFGSQWYNSDGHRDILMNPDYTHAGGSREYAGGAWWAAMVFVDVCGGADPSGFSDIGSSKFYSDIVWLVDENITYGCSATRFCPDAVVTRGQMASFISRAASLGSASRDYFADDDASKHEANINRLARADVTAGCDDDRFCPNGTVTRGQMATFLVRALGLPPTSRDYYTDDNASKHEDAINRLAASGITAGCGGSHFCPNGSVTRGQMAAFLHRGFD